MSSGVTVMVQLAPGASVVQLEIAVVRVGRAGLPVATANITDSAGALPVFVMVNFRGFPVRVGDLAVSRTDSTSAEGLIDSVVDGVAPPPVGAPAPPPLPPQAANSTAEHKDIQRAEER
ncbi:hypothetical protein [Hydrogenophaga sp. ANAO-22]|uniref:hypothetical protein n=1 Tax=Hydrogenophaga sp. ANAO-22 TaxID=3166645 RepID=UPI0036D22077